jgi:alkylation response protein AidB-like acyl-CoA dehydrogenase
VFFALTDDQRDFGSAVRELLTDRYGIDALRASVEDPDGPGYPDGLWRAMGEQGWLATLVPEEFDGLGLGLVDAQVIARELGAGAAPGPWRGTVLAAEAIRRAGTGSQRKQWLPKLAAGEAIGAVALRGDASHGWPGVEYAERADLLVALDGVAGGLRLLRPEEFHATRQDSFDATTRLDRVTPSEGVGEPLPGADDDLVATLLATASVLVAADLVGIARESLTRTVDYDRDRKQFGVPVGSFQAIKHDLANLHVNVTMAEHAVLFGAHALDSGPVTDHDVAVAVAVAKAKASDVGTAATAAMIQYHGGIGYTWEHEAHFFYKRAKRLAGLTGTASDHRNRIAELTIG